MATLPDLSSSDEDDMFIKPGAGSGLASIYSTSTTTPTTTRPKRNDSDNDDEDDEMDELPKVSTKRKRRGRTKKNTSGSLDKAIDVDAVDVSEDAAKQKSASVFSVSPSINPVNVVDVDELEDEVNSAAAQTLIRTAIVLEKAKGKRGAPSLEDRLEEESTFEARRHAEELRKIDEPKKGTSKHDSRSQLGGLRKESTSDDVSGGSSTQDAKGPAIKLRVRYEETVVRMKILKSDPLKKMLEPFCHRVKLDSAKAVMEVDGEEVEDDDTPNTYELEDDNLVDVRLRK